MDFGVTLLFVMVSVVLGQAPSKDERVVHTPQGIVHGKLHRHGNYGTVSAYMGIPYAQPPIGPLRFKPPQQLSLLDSDQHINATEDSPACIQDPSFLSFMRVGHEFNKETSEDCLYLNVYVPRSKPKVSNLPVMVWIHGGAFITGSGSMYDGRILSGKGQVIVVTINYRLGVLGFLPTGGTESTLGLQDQIMALQWVQKMIGSFGGNPNEVTIFGESAGGASVSLLSVSPRAKGLFKRVIAQSGVATSPWVIIPENVHEKMEVINSAERDAGCQSPPLKCLENATTTRLVHLTTLLNMTQPEIDHDVIPFDYATNTGLVHPGLEFIMGTVPDEGATMIYLTCNDMYQTECDIYEGMDVQALKDTLALPDDVDDSEARSVMKHYNTWYPRIVLSGNMNMMAATKLLTDRGYKIPTNRTATRLDNAGFKVRVYEFNSVSEHAMFQPVPWSKDAQHTDELPFLFGNIQGGVDGQVSSSLIKLWTDFAKGELSETRWPLFHSEHAHYLYVDDNNPRGRVREPYFAEFKNFLWRIYLRYGQFPVPIASSGPVARPTLLSLLLTVIALRVIKG